MGQSHPSLCLHSQGLCNCVPLCLDPSPPMCTHMAPFLTSFRPGLKWQLCSEVCPHSQFLIPALFPSLAFTTIDQLCILLMFLLVYCLSPTLLCQSHQVRDSAEFLSTYYMPGTAVGTKDPERNLHGRCLQWLMVQQRGLPACDWATWGGQG